MSPQPLALKCFDQAETTAALVAPFTDTEVSFAPGRRVGALPSRKGPAYVSKSPQFSLPEGSTVAVKYGWWMLTWLSSAACT
ncbi:MAG TPA: hypothetical protein VMK66_07055 [Myxococcales bacterium]|nr:hypothetical protein [Myxococcales bacterium]